MTVPAWLHDEIKAWVAEGIISADQAATIRERYAQRDLSQRRRGVVETIATIGALVAGLGVVLFFAANWDGIPRPGRVALLLALIAASYGGGFFLRDVRGTHTHVGAALLLLGGIAFGASLFLVGQMYHVRAHDPLAFLVLAVGSGVTAVVVRSRALATLSLGSAVAWLVFEAAVAGPGETFDEVEYLPVVGTLAGTALYGLGTGLGDRLDVFRVPARWLGYLLATVGVFVFTFRDAVDSLADRGSLGTGLGLGLVSLALLAGVGAAALALWSERPTRLYEAATLGAVAAVMLLAVLVPERGGGDPIVYPLVFNVLLAALALGAIVVGYENDEQWLATLGLAWVGIDLIARYLDFFWSMLPRSLAFVGVGIVILLLAVFLERQRKRLGARMATR
jgi:uncharacterized membrane protein